MAKALCRHSRGAHMQDLYMIPVPGSPTPPPPQWYPPPPPRPPLPGLREYVPHGLRPLPAGVRAALLPHGGSKPINCQTQAILVTVETYYLRVLTLLLQ